ncbi:helix-turn-helix domain-containing protein [Paenibacillus humicola]|uniref:helix-turn-helix domain-containing protein n=1 Tax=Paenibacillus humicola TaxID=3110540 RepID=UPI0030843AFC
MKYIWSYLFILLIPLILTTLFIYQNAVSSLRSQIEQSRYNQLTQTKNIIDARLKELGEIASRLSYDDRLTPSRVHDPYYSRDAIQALDQYKATSSIIGELFLYFHKDQRIYSSKGMSSLDVFADKYSFRSWNRTELVKDLNGVKYPTMRPADAVRQTYLQKSILAYLVPITPNNPNPHGTVLYFIEESELNGLIDSILGNYKGLSYIFDDKGQILAANRQGESIGDADARSLFDLPPGIHSRTLNGIPHSVVSVKSGQNGWTYLSVMPSTQFFSSVVHVRSFIIMLLCIAALAGAFIALLLARMQYEPISSLAEYANHPKRTAGGSPPRGNELERIHFALREYSSLADLQEPYARNHVLYMLLKYGNTDSLTPELQEAFGLRFDRPRHFAMVTGWGARNDGRQDPESLRRLLARAEYAALGACTYGVELPQADHLALIVSFVPDGMTEEFLQVRQIVEAVRGRMRELFDVIPAIGVGTCYSKPEQLNPSYIEACSAFELRAEGSAGTATYFEKLSDEPKLASWIPGSELLKLSQSLKQGSYDVAAQTIGTAVRSLQTSRPSDLLARCICFDILNTMLRTASELDFHDAIHDIAPHAISGGSWEDAENVFLGLASRICAQVERKNRIEEHSQIDRIAAYIDRHYADHTLSLEKIAFEFAVSPSHVSRSFKEKVGLNFIQYIWQKRLEEVKRQLTSTSDPLKDIIARVGYLDTPNFIRRFKKETGLTPGQFRKLYDSAGETDDSPDGTEGR